MFLPREHLLPKAARPMGVYGAIPQGGPPARPARSSSMLIVASVIAGLALASVALVASSRSSAATSVSSH